ncbi:MAG: hypothetical protein KJO21_08030 [Verrucomicrobiae bacterium]|nr:hypothetical protein [Verrucomicrobiae bacterium]NNJ43422.1 hypothetical protein [Akkermansiaceae bacterium]
MKTTGTTHPHQALARPGFASLITVISVGVALLIILVSMYENTVESQTAQKNNLLKNDYQQRENAFLRALTNIIPNKAMMCMQDDTQPWEVREQLRWNQIIDEALVLSNSNTAVDPSVASALGISSLRSGNGADSQLARNTVVKPLAQLSYQGAVYENAVTPGTNLTATSDFPPPLECSDWEQIRDAYYPIVSYHKKYGSSATGWVMDSVTDFPQYNRVLAPKLHFNYQDGATIIAKHNWWAFELSFAEQDATTTKLVTRTKKYLVSLYEIPSQLPISASSYTTFGTHTDGTEWSNITLSGGIFAEKVKTEGSFSTDSISSRQGVQLSSETTVNGTVTGGNAGSNPFASHAREVAQSKGDVFPISSASDGGRVSFVPINRGLEFYDRFQGTGDSPESINAVSPTSWDYYSIGAKQCQMRLDVTDVVSADDQTPTQIQFSYWSDIPDDGLEGVMVTETFSKGDNWPDLTDDGGLTFPFHVESSTMGRPCIAIYLDQLAAYLATKNAAHFDINKSISINVDYINNLSIAKPPFPSFGGDMAVMLLGAKDLTSYTEGFSLVTNMRLIIADDVNVTPTTPPSGVIVPDGELYYPSISFFAPEKRYGDSSIALKIDIDGQLGSLAKDNTTPTRIADLKSGIADEVVPENINANLKSIIHPAALPPINLMNWMVVVREIHPKYVPESTPGDIQ